VDWLALLCARRMRCRQLLPWLFRVGRLTGTGRCCGHDRSHCSRHRGSHVPPSGWSPGVDAPLVGPPWAHAPAGTELYRTSCIVGHLEVDDGVTPTGKRLWHCRRPGCGAGRFARFTQLRSDESLS
jgi:hypothetical protein